MQSIKRERRLLLDPQRYIRIIAGLSNEAVFSYFDTRISAYATLSPENDALIILEYVMITEKVERMKCIFFRSAYSYLEFDPSSG